MDAADFKLAVNSIRIAVASFSASIFLTALTIWVDLLSPSVKTVMEWITAIVLMIMGTFVGYLAYQIKIPQSPQISSDLNSILNEKVEISKFKNLVMDMHRGFPNFQYRGMVEQVIVTDAMRNTLIKSKFLVKEKHKDGKGQSYEVYMLGPAALPLVSSWSTEDLSRKINVLTTWIIIISLVSLFLSLGSLIFSALPYFRPH